MLGKVGKGGGGKPGQPVVYLAAYGKHPAWNDHIDDLGIETDLLCEFKSLVYIEGIGAAVDSGKWEKLEPDARLDGFAHVMLLRTHGELLLGRMWSSRDGKGRAKYPMVVVCQVGGVAMEKALEFVMPELETLQRRCEAATTAAQVVSILDSARASLRARAESVASDGPDLTVPAEFLASVAQSPEYGPDGLGFYRVLYHIEREAPAFVGNGLQPQAKAGRITQAPSVHLRLPRVGGAGRNDGLGAEGGGGVGALRGGVRAMLSVLEPWTPMLLIAPLKHGFVDVILGEPQGSQVFCLQAGEKAMPLTTHIPYTIEPGFKAGVDAWLAAGRAGGGRMVERTSESAAKRLGLPAGRFLSVLVAAGACWGLGGGGGFAAADPPGAGAPSQPDSRQRYNEALAALKQDMAEGNISDEKAAERVRRFLSEVRAMPGGVAYLAAVQRLTTDIETNLARKVEPGVARETLRLGPGSTGVYAGSGADAEGRVVRFKPGAGEAMPELAFARVDLPGGAVVYIGTTEVSVGQFGAIVAGRTTGADLDRLKFQWFDRAADPRKGARTWEWGTAANGKGVVIPAREWQSRVSLAKVTEYPEGGEPAQPTAQSPMNYVSPTVAEFAARLVGCRLPTLTEWNAAKAQHAGKVALKDCNLRDQAWLKQYEHAKAMNAAGQRVQYPDSGAFSAGVPGGRAGEVPKAYEWDDATLWFTPVAVGGGEVVHNLVGNVAEYVLDWTGEPPEARATAVADFVTLHGSSMRVVGGSALGDIAVAPDAPQPVVLAEAEEGYSDVGFRLAFSAGTVSGASLAGRLSGLLEPLPVLPVR